jgi:signal transduction histidine kinase/ActR/RegA family two-component response regulator
VNPTRQLLIAIGSLRSLGPKHEWTTPFCNGLLSTILHEMGAAKATMYRLGQGEVELLATCPEEAPALSPAVLEAMALDETGLYSQALFEDPEVGVQAVLAWPGAPGERAALLLTWPQGAQVDPDRLGLLGMLLACVAENAQLAAARERELRHNELIFRVAQAFMSTVNLRELVDLIVSLVADTFKHADNCVLHLLDRDSDSLVAMSVSSKSMANSPPPNAPPLRTGVGAAGLALLTGQIVSIGDVSKDDRFLPRSGARRIASLLTAPLMVRTQTIGTLTVDSSELHAFDEEDERLLLTLASLAATAIDNADLVKNLQQSLNELRDTQAQLLQAEKLSALGQLISGITHEINNPLAAISGYAQLLRMGDDLDPQTRQDATRIYEQAQRAARIVRNLLTFAREHRSMQRPTDVNRLLQQSVELMAYQLRVEGIAVDLRLAPEMLGVMGDPYQLQQVFLNLMANARDAMVQVHGGGRLTVRSELDGATVRIRIIDTGPGLTQDAKKHLFEPFFTTKEVGKGTGLGLSICFGIISGHAGRIYLADTETPGAEFVVELPHVPNLSELDEEQDLTEMRGMTNRLVLLVEDEEPVARIVQRVLSRDGHRTVVTHDGHEALSYLKRASEGQVPFDLIISDIRMPNMDGVELYDVILNEFPEMKENVLFMTGDSISASTRAFLDEQGVPVLIKPFDLEELRQAISDSLE